MVQNIQKSTYKRSHRNICTYKSKRGSLNFGLVRVPRPCLCRFLAETKPALSEAEWEGILIFSRANVHRTVNPSTCLFTIPPPAAVRVRLTVPTAPLHPPSKSNILLPLPGDAMPPAA